MTSRSDVLFLVRNIASQLGTGFLFASGPYTAFGASPPHIPKHWLGGGTPLPGLRGPDALLAGRRFRY